MTREEIIIAIKNCAEKIGHAPSVRELRQTVSVSGRCIQKHFGTYGEALKACGLERKGCGYKVSKEEVFEELARVIRELGKMPTMVDWQQMARFSVQPVLKRAGNWKEVPEAFLQYVRKNGLEDELGDVAIIVAGHMKRKQEPVWISAPQGAPISNSSSTTEEVFYGTPLLPTPMTCAPTNEMGVIFLFGALAVDLGFAVTRLQMAYPDGEAWRKVGENRWKRVRIEFEYESRNFLAHGHRAENCDLIVCWQNNWPDCPLEVIELSKVFKRMW